VCCTYLAEVDGARRAANDIYGLCCTKLSEELRMQ
jgi:hypothetical protein